MPSKRAVCWRFPSVWIKHWWIALAPSSSSVCASSRWSRAAGLWFRGVAAGRSSGRNSGNRTVSGRHEHGSLQHALQFANIAGPGVAAQAIEHLGRGFANVAAQFAAEAPQIDLHQHQQVVTPLAQGRRDEC